MGTYITHEGLPFHGNLKKIRIRSCRATDPSLPGFDEEQLLEITQNGEVKLTQKTPTGTEKTKTRISQADADHIFAAFSEVFASYRRERIPSVSGHWRVRLLTDDNEVYFYHGANGQDYRYRDESLTDILRQRTGMPGLFGLSVKAETKSKVKSIEISLEQTAADEVKDRYANEYGICMHDTTEWLLISSEGTITYNRRVASVGRVSLQYELKDKVAESLKVYADTVETNWEELFDGFDRLYAITFSSGIEFVNKVINKFSYAEVVFGCEKIIANDIAAIMSVQIDSVQRLAKSKSAGNLANRLDDGSLQLYVSRDTKSHEKIFILESADHKRVRVITGSANMSASAFCGIQRENIVCFDDEAAFSHYKVLFETFKETCSDNVSYKAVVNTMNQEDYLKENIKEVPVFQSIEKQKLVFLEQAQPEDEVEYEIVADVKKMQELVKPIMPKMPVQANRIVVAAEPMRVFGKRYTEVRRVAAEAVKQLPKLHIDYDAGTMTFNDENIDLNPNLSEVAKNIKSIQKFFSGMDYFYGDVEQAKKDYFKYMTWYLATPFMAYLRYFASRNNYDTKLFPMYGVIYGDSNGGKTTFIKFLVKLMCGETVKMNTTEDFTATRIDGLKRVCEGLPLNIDDLAKTQFQNHSERVIKNDEWGISDRLVNYPAVSITSNKITSLTKDLSKRAIICRIGAKIDNERGAKNSKRVNESMSELTTAFYGEYVRRMLVCIDEMTTEMRENANGKEYFPDIFHASSSVIADIFEACGIDLPDYVRILYYNDYMGDESIGRAAIEKIELAWQADPSKFRVDKKQNRLIYSYPPDGPWYELKYIADELPNSLEAEISGGNQLIMNYEQAQELFGIKFRRWLGIFNL